MQQSPRPHDRPQALHTTPGDVFEALYAANHRRVLAYCARRASRADAWDAAAEVFAIAWRRIDEVPRDDMALPWLFAVAYRVISNQRRSQERRRRLNERVARLPVDAAPFPEAQLIRREEEAEMMAALERLRDADREIVLLVLWEELPRRHIAAALGISRVAVDQRYSRARRRLAAQLRHENPTVGSATPSERGEGGAT